MWKQLIELGKQIVSVTRKTQQHEADIKELRQEIKELRQELRAVAVALSQMQSDVRHDRELAARDRENLMLRPGELPVALGAGSAAAGACGRGRARKTRAWAVRRAV